MIFENTSRWHTDDLRAYVDRALALANEAHEQIRLKVDTVVLATHSSMRNDMSRPSLNLMTDMNLVRILLITPERAGVEAISALGAVTGDGNAMPAKMITQLWESSVKIVRHQLWNSSFSPAMPADLPGIRIMKACGRAPTAIERRLASEQRKRTRVIEALAKHDGKIARLQKKLAKARA